jgi:hypothetical protein
MIHFDHGYVTCLYVPIYLVGNACTQCVGILLVYVSILACCSARCIFEKKMLAFVDKGEERTQFMFPRGVLHQGKKNWGKCICSGGACIVQGELAFMHLRALFLLNFSCALLPMVSSPFASP